MSNFFQDIEDAWTGKRVEFIEGEHKGELGTCVGASNSYGGFGLDIVTDTAIFVRVYSLTLDDIKQIENGIIVMDEETYLCINKASKLDIGDSALHKNRGRHSDKTWSKIIDQQAAKDKALIERRNELRKEYVTKVEAKELRPPSRLEKLVIKSHGDSSREDVQAARNILKKKYNITPKLSRSITHRLVRKNPPLYDKI